MAILETQEDPRGLIREAYRIEGISPHECRTIFLDWALSLPEGTDTQEMAARLLQADPPADHPMTAVLRDATKEPPARIRRGGRRARLG